MEVETKNASLDTLAVTIQALHVSGKQMTLAVFRQLTTDYIETERSALWGVVRYMIGNCDTWLVFSGGGLLCRRAMWPESYRYRICHTRATMQSSADIAERDKAILERLPQLFIAV